jgi:hypothetical protein
VSEPKAHTACSFPINFDGKARGDIAFSHGSDVCLSMAQRVRMRKLVAEVEPDGATVGLAIAVEW